MKRAIPVLLMVCCLTMTFLSSGCAGFASAEVSEPRTVEDMRGKVVELSDTVDNYCILYSSATPFLAMLDEGFSNVRMIPNGYEDWLYLFFPDMEGHARTINKRTITAEEIVENGTQIVFCADSTNADVIEALEKVGIPCINLTVRDTDDMLKAVQIVADVFDTSYAHEKADAFCDFYQNTVAKCIALANEIPEDQMIRLLSLGNYDATTGSGVNTWICSWANELHFDYILPSEDGADKVELTMEQIYEFDPDVVLFSGYKNCLEEAYAMPEWQALPATQRGNLYQSPICLDVWTMPNTQCAMAYEWGLVTFYPDYAGDLNLVQDTIDFYKQFYGYELTHEEAEAIIAGERIFLS